ARWSRPVARSGSEGATVYTGPGRTRARPGRVARVRDGWAYRLEHPQATTVGVVRHRGAGPAALGGTLAGDLGIGDLDTGHPELFVRVGMRPAGVQWSRQPVRPGRLAVGDAALALNPVAGQGVRFAVSSALAAAAVLRSWSEGSWREGAGQLASDYYRCFVNGVRSRHLAKLTVIAGERSEPAAADNPLDPGRRLRWVAHVERVGVNRGGRIVAEECCVLPDGGLVRWVGGIDLLLLRDAVADGRTPPEICAALARAGVADISVRALVAWAIRVGAAG
ncbi:MAG: hypothetical protein ACRDTA_29970, partial [Pseudonocardiaceae bacterium]